MMKNIVVLCAMLGMSAAQYGGFGGGPGLGSSSLGGMSLGGLGALGGGGFGSAFRSPFGLGALGAGLGSGLGSSSLYGASSALRPSYGGKTQNKTKNCSNQFYFLRLRLRRTVFDGRHVVVFAVLWWSRLVDGLVDGFAELLVVRIIATVRWLIIELRWLAVRLRQLFALWRRLIRLGIAAHSQLQ